MTETYYPPIAVVIDVLSTRAVNAMRLAIRYFETDAGILDEGDPLHGELIEAAGEFREILSVIGAEE